MTMTRTNAAKQRASADYADTSEVLYRFDDGWTVRQCQTNEDVSREGILMRSCLEDLQLREPRYILSLRDPSNLPHVSFGLKEDNMYEVYGIANSEPKRKYLDRITDFHTACGNAEPIYIQRPWQVPQ